VSLAEGGTSTCEGCSADCNFRAYRPQREYSQMASLETSARGLRPGLPKRPALDEAAIERIRQEQEKAAEREFVRFAFYKVDPAWRRLPVETRNAHKQEFVDVVRDHGEHFMVYAYSLVGTRGDTDFLLWQA